MVASDAVESDNFGAAALEGDTILVGANNADASAVESSGAAYIFTRSGSIWTELEKLIAGDPEDGARLGLAVALTSGSALVGTPFTDAGAVAEAGAVCSYEYAGRLFAGGFESGDLSAWSSAVGG